MPSATERAEQRKRIWRHNSFFGHCAMGTVHMQAIYNAKTTTEESRDLARQIHELLTQLSASLRTRKDQEPQ